MSTDANPNALVPAPPALKARPEAHAVVDDSGRAIVTLLQKAAETTEIERTRAMSLAASLSHQLDAVEERVRAAEAEIAHFRERATRAEAWLLRIYNEAEQVFFQKDERGGRNAPPERNPAALRPDNRTGEKPQDKPRAGTV
jgi:hypothetical protein